MSFKNRKKYDKDFRKQDNCAGEHQIREADVPLIKEPRPLCSICGQPIELIAEAISDNGHGYSHFDCVIEKLKKDYNVKENEKLSYVGQGNFAVFYLDEEGSYKIREKINYETVSEFDSMKKLVNEARNEQ